MFKQFKAMINTQFNFLIKVVQFDWREDYKPFTEFLSEEGIQHRLICPHTHHQNGVIERKHIHIVDMGLALVSQAAMPLHYWDHAFLSGVYLINKLPSKSIQNEIPFQKLFHKIQITLRIFGCTGFPLLRPYNFHKLQYR